MGPQASSYWAVGISVHLQYIIYYCITNYPKQEDLTASYSLCGSAIQPQHKLGHLFQGTYKAAIKVLARVGLIKRNEIELFVVRWMDLDRVKLSQKEKNKYCMLTHIYGI